MKLLFIFLLFSHCLLTFSQQIPLKKSKITYLPNLRTEYSIADEFGDHPTPQRKPKDYFVKKLMKQSAQKQEKQFQELQTQSENISEEKEEKPTTQSSSAKKIQFMKKYTYEVHQIDSTNVVKKNKGRRLTQRKKEVILENLKKSSEESAGGAVERVAGRTNPVGINQE